MLLKLFFHVLFCFCDAQEDLWTIVYVHVKAQKNYVLSFDAQEFDIPEKAVFFPLGPLGEQFC